MRCPKCGNVLQKTNDGSYVCDPNCKYVFDSCKIVKNQNGKMRKHPPIVEKAYSIIESRIGRVKTDKQDTCVYNYCFEIYMFPYIETKEWRYKDWPRTHSFFNSEFSEQAGKIFDRIIKELS